MAKDECYDIANKKYGTKDKDTSQKNLILKEAQIRAWIKASFDLDVALEWGSDGTLGIISHEDDSNVLDGTTKLTAPQRIELENYLKDL